jgi:hypothetical protein
MACDFGSIVPSVVTKLQAGWSEFDPARAENFLCIYLSRLALGLALPSTLCVTGMIKRLGHVADYLIPSSAKVTNAWSIPPYSLMCLHSLLLHLSTGTLYSSDNFTFQGRTLIHMIIVQHLYCVDIPIRMVVPGSNTVLEAGYPEWGFSWFFSVPPGECRDSTLMLGHGFLLPNPFHFIILLSECSCQNFHRYTGKARSEIRSGQCVSQCTESEQFCLFT